MFGPLHLRPGSPDRGTVGATPKPGWEGTDVLAAFRDGLGVPAGIDTDVNGAALAERRWGAGRGLHSLLYLTIGTGVGGGAVVDGHVLHGIDHPEMGHLRLPRHPQDTFEGICPFHGDCLEGMTSGPAIAARWGRRAEDLGVDTAAAVVLAGWYLGTAVANLTLALAPQRVILGGGVMKLPGLFAAVRDRYREVLGSYFQAPEAHDPPSFIVPPGLGDRAGVLGAIALAESTFDTAPK
jgi:fructokinase